jgi:hypothetical protein
MKKHENAGNDGEVIVLDEESCVTDTRRRPASPASRKAAEQYLAREAEARKLMEQMKNEAAKDKQ